MVRQKNGESEKGESGLRQRGGEAGGTNNS